MNEVDDSVLEFFAEQEGSIVLPPTPVWYNLVEVRGVLDKSRETIRRRMRKLDEEWGLLERVEEDRAYYKMTEKGRAYLAGELEAEDLEDDLE